MQARCLKDCEEANNVAQEMSALVAFTYKPPTPLEATPPLPTPPSHLDCFHVSDLPMCMLKGMKDMPAQCLLSSLLLKNTDADGEKGKKQRGKERGGGGETGGGDYFGFCTGVQDLHKLSHGEAGVQDEAGGIWGGGGLVGSAGGHALGSHVCVL